MSRVVVEPVNITTGVVEPETVRIVQVSTAGVQGIQGEPGTPGADGADGTDGVDGTDGSGVLSGLGPPDNALGIDDDFYIDLTARSIYGPKTAGAWGAPTDLVGPQGIQGVPGQDGADGANGLNGADGADGIDGADGRTIWNGSGGPANGLGADDDFYLNNDNKDFYGPKAAGAWGAPTSLVGPQGIQGIQGPPGDATTAGISDLSDVTITAAAEGEYLRRDGTGQWVDSPILLVDLPAGINAGQLDGMDSADFATAAALAAHLADADDAHDASSVSFAPTGTLASTSVQAAIAELLAETIALTQKGAANGVATLGADGLVPTSQIPAIAINDTFTVASQAAMLALAAQRGDMAIRSDFAPARTFVLSADDATVLANWVEVSHGRVASVNGQTGIVVLAAADVGAAATNDARLTDARTPTDLSVTNAKVAAGAAIAESKLALASDAAAATASRRSLGNGATQAAAGNHAHGASARTVATKNAAYTTTAADDVLLCSGTWTLGLVTAVGNSGKIFDIKNTDTGVITVDPNGAQTIDGSTTVDLSQFDSITVVSDGANWHII